MTRDLRVCDGGRGVDMCDGGREVRPCTPALRCGGCSGTVPAQWAVTLSGISACNLSAAMCFAAQIPFSDPPNVLYHRVHNNINPNGTHVLDYLGDNFTSRICLWRAQIGTISITRWRRSAQSLSCGQGTPIQELSIPVDAWLRVRYATDGLDAWGVPAGWSCSLAWRSVAVPVGHNSAPYKFSLPASPGDPVVPDGFYGVGNEVGLAGPNLFSYWPSYFVAHGVPPPVGQCASPINFANMMPSVAQCFSPQSANPLGNPALIDNSLAAIFGLGGSATAVPVPP